MGRRSRVVLAYFVMSLFILVGIYGMILGLGLAISRDGLVYKIAGGSLVAVTWLLGFWALRIRDRILQR